MYIYFSICLASLSHSSTQKAFQKKVVRILEALDEIFDSAKSKQGLKPFSKSDILGFAGWFFFSKMPPWRAIYTMKLMFFFWKSSQ